MDTILSVAKVRVGDESDSYTLVNKSEYKPDIRGYHLTWLGPKGLTVQYHSAWSYIAITHLGRI